MFPRRAVGSVVGIGGMAGALGGATMAVAVGVILDKTGGNYSLVFFVAGSAYLIALLIIHLLSPSLEQVEDVEALPRSPFAAGTLIGFGFIGLIFGSFVGWLIGLLSRVAGPTLFEYLVLAGVVGAVVGVIGGLVFAKSNYGSRASA
jgi:hypothetical protein